MTSSVSSAGGRSPRRAHLPPGCAAAQPSACCRSRSGSAPAKRKYGRTTIRPPRRASRAAPVQARRARPARAGETNAASTPAQPRPSHSSRATRCTSALASGSAAPAPPAAPWSAARSSGVRAPRAQRLVQPPLQHVEQLRVRPERPAPQAQDEARVALRRPLSAAGQRLRSVPAGPAAAVSTANRRTPRATSPVHGVAQRQRPPVRCRESAGDRARPGGARRAPDECAQGLGPAFVTGAVAGDEQCGRSGHWVSLVPVVLLSDAGPPTTAVRRPAAGTAAGRTRPADFRAPGTGLGRSPRRRHRHVRRLPSRRPGGRGSVRPGDGRPRRSPTSACRRGVRRPAPRPQRGAPPPRSASPTAATAAVDGSGTRAAARRGRRERPQRHAQPAAAATRPGSPALASTVASSAGDGVRASGSTRADTRPGARQRPRRAPSPDHGRPPPPRRLPGPAGPPARRRPRGRSSAAAPSPGRAAAPAVTRPADRRRAALATNRRASAGTAAQCTCR